jgi:hypothetical protein
MFVSADHLRSSDQTALATDDSVREMLMILDTSGSVPVQRNQTPSQYYETAYRLPLARDCTNTMSEMTSLSANDVTSIQRSLLPVDNYRYRRANSPSRAVGVSSEVHPTVDVGQDNRRLVWGHVTSFYDPYMANT